MKNKNQPWLAVLKAMTHGYRFEKEGYTYVYDDEHGLCVIGRKNVEDVLLPVYFTIQEFAQMITDEEGVSASCWRALQEHK